ncbi:AAA family ATPase [Staphylococcus massiliensis]|uniref:AAA family ATPase n=1 Tax=Staphylococcus massiliensis TaxID=555791 RepID=UPI001EDEC391|nr:AAA family ATPase [Staphylococcus massiliensis]MCG3399628.1 AAA family ATPase [Staphylococcus massiliensis]MCG3402150.1 AAA family ATPase [Staphylococcus massiliensis]
MFIKGLRTHFEKENAYWHNIPAIRALDTFRFRKPVTIFVGENGSGKSTLIEAIAVNYGTNAEGGGRNFNFATRETHAGLHEEITLSKLFLPEDTFFLRAEGMYNVATMIEDRYTDSKWNNYGGKSLHKRSHGEAFLSIMTHRFGSNGLYILDEPESALSPMRQLTMLRLIDDLVQKGCQFIISTHSPILMSYPNAEIYELNDDGIEQVDYKETDHYIVMKSFLENPDKMLNYLFIDELEE